MSSWLVPESQRHLTPNRYKAPDVNTISALLLHYTAGYSGASSAAWLCNPDAKASAHFVVDRDGVIFQLAPLEDRTWHAGGASSRWRGMPVNSRSIGIEIANLGPLYPDGKGGWVDAYKKTWKGTPFFDAKDKAWEPYPEAQVAAVLGLVTELRRRCPILDLKDAAVGQQSRICGHQDVDPTRKIDPGPAWPWERIRI